MHVLVLTMVAPNSSYGLSKIQITKASGATHILPYGEKFSLCNIFVIRPWKRIFVVLFLLHALRAHHHSSLYCLDFSGLIFRFGALHKQK